MKMLIFILPLCWMLSVESMSVHLREGAKSFNQGSESGLVRLDLRGLTMSKSAGQSTQQTADKSIPLSMVETSVDDMYLGCNEAMMKTVKDKYKNELGEGSFKSAWENAGKEVASKKENNAALTEDHIKALCGYTSNDIYSEFNGAVRMNGNVYTSSFKFHILHFFLTSAIQILNTDDKCLTTYRRTKSTFTGEVNQRIRFGTFASSSQKDNLDHFGKKSCFEIKTCSGALIEQCSVFENEKEVLIPPYEVFLITKKYKKKDNSPTNNEVKSKLNDCEVVFVLESAGIQSNLNCHMKKSN